MLRGTPSKRFLPALALTPWVTQPGCNQGRPMFLRSGGVPALPLQNCAFVRGHCQTAPSRAGPRKRASSMVVFLQSFPLSFGLRNWPKQSPRRSNRGRRTQYHQCFVRPSSQIWPFRQRAERTLSYSPTATPCRIRPIRPKRSVDRALGLSQNRARPMPSAKLISRRQNTLSAEQTCGANQIPFSVP